MHKVVILLLILIFSSYTRAQSTYDSLKQIYSAQRIFENRVKGDVTLHIKETLATISDLEIRQLTACAIAENVYGYGFVSNQYLLKLVDSVIESPQSEVARTIATTVKTELTRSLLNTHITPIRLPNAMGDTLTLSNYYRSGKDYVVIDLWATWCAPCIAEMKKINTLRQQYNIEFYSISIDRELGRVQKFVSKNNDYTWPIVWAGEGSSLQDYFKGRLIPAFFIVDKSGIIVSHVVGRGLEEELKKLYKK